MSEEGGEQIRVLLCRLGGIGDVIQTLPLARYIKKKYKGASVEYLTSENVAELLKDCCPFLDSVWSFNKKEKVKAVREIKDFSNERVDHFINLHNSLSFYFFNLFSIKAKRYFQYKKDNNSHAVVNFAKTFIPDISAFELDSKTLFVNNNDQVKNLLSKHNLKEGKYICFVPGVGKIREHRAWPIDNWLSLTKKIIHKEKDLKIVFLGGKDEERLSGYLQSFNEQVINLIGTYNLSDTAKIISKASYLISGDTGLIHLANALSTKVIGLYGPTLTKRTGPFLGNNKLLVAKNCKCIQSFFESKKCKLTNNPYGYCMNSLTVEDVLSAINYDLVHC